jgi:hypothetical protein
LTDRPIEEIAGFKIDQEDNKISGYEANQQTLDNKIIEHPIMQSIKSSIASSSSDFSNCDKISERFAEIITMKEEVKIEGDNGKIKRR